MRKLENFFERYEVLILMALFALVVLINSQGLSWGLPGLWNPDEIAKVANLAQKGEFLIDQTDVHYPSLPKYFMLFFARINASRGLPEESFYLTVRFISVLLSAALTWLAYELCRKLHASRTASFLAALVVATNAEVALNAHFAHNDLYLAFFVSFTMLAVLNYYNRRQKIWLYVAFFSTGLAASSKYNGAVILLPVLFAYFLLSWKSLFKSWLSTLETLFVGGGLCILGYGLGTPMLLTWPSHYIKRLLPALKGYAQYARTPTSQPGYVIQWEIILAAFGAALTILFLLALVFFFIGLTKKATTKISFKGNELGGLSIVLVAILALDLPILTSYNVQLRFFIPMLPLVAAFCLKMIDWTFGWLKQEPQPRLTAALTLLLLLVFISSALRVASITLAIKNDSRIAAGKFLETLPAGKTLEFSLYTPNFHYTQLKVEQYPLYFLKFEKEELPEDSRFVYNDGENGVELR